MKCDVMRHRHFPDAAARAGLLLLLLLPLACGDPAGPAGFDAVRLFDGFWRDFDQTYSYFEYKRIDWNAARAAFRARAEAAPDEAALVSVLTEMVAPMRDVHIWFRRPDGGTQPTYQPATFRNWNRDVWLQYVSANNYHSQVTNWGYADLGGIGYLVIGAWNDSQVRIAGVDSVLELLRDKPAMIVDVRMNGGGNDALALQVAGRFTTVSRVVEYIQFRDGPRHTDFTALQARTLAPRGPWQYQRPVVLLSGRGIYSSNESFVAAMGEIPNVTIMGDTTGGSSGNPKEFPLFGGWAYAVPRWIAYTADHRVIEWNGIPPDIEVPATAADFAAGRDPVLDAALARLRAQVGLQEPRRPAPH
jgi:hypothetical protein